VQNEEASSTALLIAASVVLLHHHPKYSDLVSRTSADICARVLENHSTRTRLFASVVRQGWFRPIARLIERITIPGILLHYALRKRCIASLVRSALMSRTTQVVIIGAGFDPLSFELLRNFPGSRFWEIDHPATQRHKLLAFDTNDAARLHFIAMNLATAPFDGELLIKNGFHVAERTSWIAEGLLMYLTPGTILSLMRTLANLSAPGSEFVFTFMEKQSGGAIRFDSQTKVVDRWLHRRGERFLWGSTRGELVELVRPWQIIRFFDHDDLREMELGLAGERIARGEVICLARI
jgi:methyltransferase (TIGR00027 family)